MRANEFLKEAIAPIAPIAPQASNALDQTIAQTGSEQPAQVTKPQATPQEKPIIDVIRVAAGKQPVKPTGNAGIDNLLFKKAALSKGAGGLTGLIGKGLNAVGGAFAAQTSIQRAKFDRPMRSGAQMAAGLTAEPNQNKTISTGQQQAHKLSANIQPATATEDQAIALIKANMTANQPVNPTGNPGIDRLLTKANLIPKTDAA
jgi:hypothetical protein